MGTALPATTEASHSTPAEPDAVPHHIADLTAQQQQFVELIVWGGATRERAMKALGLSQQYGYALLRNPRVLKAIRAEQEVLRTSLRSTSLHTLDRIQRQTSNKLAAVAAAKTLLNDPTAKHQTQVTVNVTPGYAIDLTEPVDVTPGAIDHDAIIRIDGGDDVL